MLQTLGTTTYTSLAQDSRKDKHIGQLSVDVSASKRSDTGGLETSLTIAEGAKVKLTTNIDVYDGLSNGARGTITKIITSKDEVQVILVTFENPHIGTNAKSTSQFKIDYPKLYR